MHTRILIVRLLLVFALGSAATAVTAQSNARLFSEVHVLRSLRQLHGAQATYQATTGAGNYGSLQDLRQAGLIDDALASGSKYGYSYIVSTATSTSTFTVNATPRSYRKTGIRSFYIDPRGEIRGGDKNGQPATIGDPIIDDCTRGSVQENERCTILDMRSLHSAQMTYNATVGNGNYGTFQQLFQAGLIRTGLATAPTRGYFYSYLIIDYVPDTQTASFKFWATPQSYPTSSVRSFYIDQTGCCEGLTRMADRQIRTIRR